MSLRPPLHVSTFQSRGCFNVWSSLSPICPCAIQLTSGERPVYDSTFSSSLSSRSARKTQVRSRKKTSERKKYVWQQEKSLAAGKSCFRSEKKRQQKMPLRSGKNSKQQKNTLRQHKSTFAAEKMHFGGSGKNPSEARNNRPRQEKNQQQRKSSFATQKVAATEKYISATGKSSSPSGYHARMHRNGCSPSCQP